MLEIAYPSLSSKPAGRLKMVLGSIIHLQDPLSAGNLEDLPGADSDHINVRTSLMRLHSVVLEGHLSQVLSVVFSPDGARIVSGSYDKTI